ncbi:Histidine kinase [Gammaproteobacteria bacterium]
MVLKTTYQRRLTKPLALYPLKTEGNPVEFTDSVRAILDDKGTNVYCISPNHTVYDALEHMSRLSIGALVVQEGDQIVGILSERDYARNIALKGRNSRDVTVREIMTGNVIIASPSETVDGCMKLLTGNQIRHLPVAEDGKLIGMITAGDLVRWIISRQKETIEQLEHYIAGGYVR